MKKELLLLFLFSIFLQTCMTRQAVIPTEKPLKEAGRVRIVPLALVNLCSEFSGPLPTSEEERMPECTNFAKEDEWVPVEFIQSPYFRQETHYSGRRLVELHNIPFYLINYYSEESDSSFYYRPFDNLAEFSQLPLKNVLFIRLGSTRRETNFSSYLTVLTLTVIPGYFTEVEENQYIRYFSNGEMQQLSNWQPAQRIWLGFIFFLWGPIIATNQGDILQKSINAFK